MPLTLKALTLTDAVVQAPMAACTDLAFRLVSRGKGMEFCYLEMVSAHSLVRRNAKTLDMMKTVPEDRPLGAQLMGADPGIMADAAAMVEEMGFDLLDINCGCPAPKVAGGAGAGSALLARPEKAGAIFQRVVSAVRSIPVTVKMRLGCGDASGGQACELARRAQDAGVCAVAVHGRTREQGYSGKADYAAIARVKAAVSIPVLGNGDVFRPEDARKLKEGSGCDAVMIGRGGLGNPWLYRNAALALAGSGGPFYEPPFEERRATALEHLELELLHLGEARGVRHMRRIAGWYFAGLPGAAAFRAAVCAAQSGRQMRALIEDFSPGRPSAGSPGAS